MDKLEKSIRHQMKYYGARMRNNHFWVPGHSVGVMRDDDAFLMGAYADVTNGIVTDIRFYENGDAYEERDWRGRTLNITDPIYEYLSDGKSWDEMIHSIYNIIMESGKVCIWKKKDITGVSEAVKKYKEIQREPRGMCEDIVVNRSTGEVFAEVASIGNWISYDRPEYKGIFREPEFNNFANPVTVKNVTDTALRMCREYEEE